MDGIIGRVNFGMCFKNTVQGATAFKVAPRTEELL